MNLFLMYFSVASRLLYLLYLSAIDLCYFLATAHLCSFTVWPPLVPDYSFSLFVPGVTSASSWPQFVSALCCCPSSSSWPQLVLVWSKLVPHYSFSFFIPGLTSVSFLPLLVSIHSLGNLGWSLTMALACSFVVWPWLDSDHVFSHSLRILSYFWTTVCLCSWP